MNEVKLLAIFVGVLFFVALFIGLHGSYSPVKVETTFSGGDIRMTLSTRKTVYNFGENIIVELTFQNMSTREVSLSGRAWGPQYDIVVSDVSNQPVCSWSQDKFWIQLWDDVTFATLDPGESWSMEWDCKRYGPFGPENTWTYAPLNPGTYYLKGFYGWWCGSSSWEIETPSLQIDVLPPA